MSLVEYDLAFYYALETYVRRDVVFVMGSIYGAKKGKGKGKGGTTLIVPQPEIEEWIKEQYENEGDNKK